ncbi:MAG: hypothetical protein ACLQDV_06895 [Candidatus Binataceae bacterium]
MDIEARLRKLESLHRTALSATVAAKANYFALADEPNSTPYAIERAKTLWQRLDARKRVIAAQLGDIEELDSTKCSVRVAHRRFAPVR